MSEIKLTVEKAEGFTKNLKKLIYKDKILESCIKYLNSFKFTENPPNIVALDKLKSYSIWKFRLPHPEANKGKSGGFRLFTYYLKEENKFILYKIYPKKDIDKQSNIDNEIKQEIKKLLN